MMWCRTKSLRVAVATLLFVCLLGLPIVAVVMRGAGSTDLSPWDSRTYDRDAAIIRLSSPDHGDQLTALVALGYKAHDLQQTEVNALLDFACRHSELDERMDMAVRRLLVQGGKLSEAALIQRLAELLRGEAPPTTAQGIERVVAVLTQIDPAYAEVITSAPAAGGGALYTVEDFSTLERIFRDRHSR